MVAMLCTIALSWAKRLADEFRQGGNPDIARCPCNGSGWIVSPVESVSQCPYHYRGQPHPEDDHAHGQEGPEYSTVEYCLRADGEETVVFQVMDDKLVNIYDQESGAPMNTKMDIDQARRLWAGLRGQGYLTEDEYLDRRAEQERYEDGYLAWYPGY